MFLVATQPRVRNSWKVYWSWRVVSITFYVSVAIEYKFDPVIMQLPLLASLQQGIFSGILCN